MNRKKLFVLLFTGLTCGCSNPSEKTGIEKELMDADRAFSRLSEQSGTGNAFEAYAHPEAVFLKPHHFPIEGREKVLAYLHAGGTEGLLTWKPMHATASRSGDQGYTYGVYEWKLDTMIRKGTYVTIWKKDSTGAWKYVLDTGNPGLEE